MKPSRGDKGRPRDSVVLAVGPEGVGCSNRASPAGHAARSGQPRRPGLPDLDKQAAGEGWVVRIGQVEIVLLHITGNRAAPACRFGQAGRRCRGRLSDSNRLSGLGCSRQTTEPPQVVPIGQAGCWKRVGCPNPTSWAGCAAQNGQRSIHWLPKPDKPPATWARAADSSPGNPPPKPHRTPSRNPSPPHANPP